MADLAAFVEHYLGEWDSRRWADAYHRLIEMGPAIVPHLLDHLAESSSPELREAIVGIACQLHTAEALPILRAGVQDRGPAVWKRSLDGLVDLATPEAISVLEAELETDIPDSFDARERQDWLREALQQARDVQASRQADAG